MNARPNLRRFYLDVRPTPSTMNQIYNWAERQNVFAYWDPNRDGQGRYCIEFRKWNKIRPEYQSWLVLMLS